MNPTVSIIVPVYNAEKQLDRCINSILKQEYTDFELLLIDDGSTDRSSGICDQYAALDSRVFAIHQENSGVSDARNLGIHRARGTYLQFLDSDDWITPDATHLLVRAAETHQCDLVISDFYRVIKNRVSRKGGIDEDVVLSREAFVSYMMENPADYYYGVLWNKLYRRDIVERHQLHMDKNIRWCEDFMFNLEYIRYAETFYALQVPIYYYVKTKGSLVSKSSGLTKIIKMKLSVFEYYNRFYQSVLDEQEYEKSRLKVYRFLIDAADDDMVPPLLLPGTKKLGDERISSHPDLLDGDGFWTEAVRNRKLLEHYMEPVALKYDLTLADLWVLLCVTEFPQVERLKQLSDITNIPRSSLLLCIQKLIGRGFIHAEESHGNDSESERKMQFSFPAAAQTILSDLSLAQRDYEQARTAELSKEELTQYVRLCEKIKSSTLKVLY